MTIPAPARTRWPAAGIRDCGPCGRTRPRRPARSWPAALLYVYDEIDGKLLVRAPGSGAVLRSMPVPQGHWDSPIVVGGRIILPTGSYHDSSSTSTIDIFHLPGR